MIEVEVKALRAAMKALDGVVERRNTIPILADVLVRAAPGAMTMVTTDLDIMMELQVALSSGKVGASEGRNQAMHFCVDASTLKAIAAKLPKDGVATIESDGNTGVLVKCGRSRFKLPTLDPDQFPIMASAEWDNQFEIDHATLTALIDAVRFAISSEETRYYLNGISLRAREDQLISAATDGHQLAKCVVELPDGAEGLPDIIIGKKTIGVIDALMDEETLPIDVSVSTGKIRFAIGAATVTAKLIDGIFPDYDRVIPAMNDKAVWIAPAMLAEAIDRVAVLSSEKTRAVRIDVAKDMAVLTVTSPENGIATEEVPVDYDGDPITVGFNTAYALNVLKHLAGDRAQLLLKDGEVASLWRDAEDARRTYVLMPMRV